MACRSNVIGAAVSGLAAPVLTESQVARLESTCPRYLKVLLGGVAQRTDLIADGGPTTTVTPTPPAGVMWRQAGLVPTRLELRVQRLREWQKVARSPGWHVQQLAAVFGALDLERETPSAISWFPSAQ
eukprot:2790805-Pyramimonas_sp.AAC.1